jgi:superfamily II DNA or RNA helicase
MSLAPAVAIQDRQYQVVSRDRCFGRWQGGDRSTLLVLPTGTGKTVVAGMIARRALDEFARRTLFIAHREELIYQAEDKLQRFELTTAIEMGDQHARDPGSFFGAPDVVIATVQTLQGRRLESWDPRAFGLIVVDEAHHARAQTYRNIFNHFEGNWLLGITATPDRGDKKNLGAVFDSLAYEYALREAIRDGYLVPLVGARLMTRADLKAIRTTGGDFNEADLAERIGPHIEELADAISRECGDRPTVVFCPDVRCSEVMADALTAKGIAARAVSGAMPRFARREALRDFNDRKFQAIVCCDLLTEGWDEPQVSCIAVCRPTRKRNRYAQMIGRGTRPHPDSGKVDCLVLDFAWETTAGHKLCTPIDLFDDSTVDDEVHALAAELIAAARGLITDPAEALDEADRIFRERKRLNIRLSGEPAIYRKVSYDPVGIGSLIGVPIKAGWDSSRANPATRRQLSYLEDLGVARPEGLSKMAASQLIGALVDREKAHLSSHRQIKDLEGLGVAIDAARAMDKTQAKEAIKFLKSQNRGKPHDPATP